MSIYSSSHEGVSDGRKGTWALARVSASRQGQKFRGRPEGPGAGGSGRRSGQGPGYPESLDTLGRLRCSRAGSFGMAGCSGQRPEVPGSPEACPGLFLFLLFHASLADGVGDPWRLHSSSSSVKHRQYLCMHTRGVSSSMPFSKGSSEHV